VTQRQFLFVVALVAGLILAAIVASPFIIDQTSIPWPDR
jgi:hypothetical protein